MEPKSFLKVVVETSRPEVLLTLCFDKEIMSGFRCFHLKLKNSAGFRIPMTSPRVNYKKE